MDGQAAALFGCQLGPSISRQTKVVCLPKQNGEIISITTTATSVVCRNITASSQWAISKHELQIDCFYSRGDQRLIAWLLSSSYCFAAIELSVRGSGEKYRSCTFQPTPLLASELLFILQLAQLLQFHFSSNQCPSFMFSLTFSLRMNYWFNPAVEMESKADLVSRQFLFQFSTSRDIRDEWAKQQTTFPLKAVVVWSLLTISRRLNG